MASCRSYAFLVLLFLAVVAVSFSNAETNVEEEKKEEKVEPMLFLHKKDPFHKHPLIKKHPLPPIKIPVIKKKPCPPITIPKPVYVHKPIPKVTIPKPVYVHKPMPKVSIPKKPCPPISKKPLFPGHP